mmetsp:Transcript_24472/g.75486  ORF Transcript_24472/g.75486 Transcript_24472/m.75486 type:complete len:273 (-) Transcript_24472:156-974(-)
MSSLCFVLGLGGSKGHVRMHIFASLISFAICGCEMSLSMTMPLMSSVSSRRPPGLPSILIMSKFTSDRSPSMTATDRTASTAICAILRLWTLMIFDDSVVAAVSTSTASSTFFSKWIVSAESASVFRATAHAASKPSATRTGWRPRSSSFSACSSSAPARTTTPVVPSPISSSCDCESSTNNRATWCSTAILSRIVAPSFVMVTSPSGETIILSMPLGPSDVRRRLDTDRAAMMLCFWASRPLMRDFCCCSFRMMKGRPYSSKTIDMVYDGR